GRERLDPVAVVRGPAPVRYGRRTTEIRLRRAGRGPGAVVGAEVHADLVAGVLAFGHGDDASTHVLGARVVAKLGPRAVGWRQFALRDRRCGAKRQQCRGDDDPARQRMPCGTLHGALLEVPGMRLRQPAAATPRVA